jgi:CubicO group peptidase (beta-lactamase class C family)
VDAVRDQLDAIVATGVPGVAAVAVGPARRVEAAAGLADLGTGEPLTVDHRFRIGSVTKIFVAALVLQLVDEGLLELDGDAAPFAEGITVRQLLTIRAACPISSGMSWNSSSRIAGISATAGSSMPATSSGW